MEAALKEIAAPNDAAGFAAARARVRALGGASAMRAHLVATGYVNAEGKLTTGVKPFNVFARVACGAMKQPEMEGENAALGGAAARFMLASNRLENDEYWASDSPEWVGKASMSERHRFMTTRDLSWEWFNVLSFGLVGTPAALREAIQTLEAMRDAAKTFTRTQPGWSPTECGMYFHCFPHNSVNSLHMHLVDLGATGPSFAYHAHKNLPVGAVISVLRDELAAAEQSDRLVWWREKAPWVLASAAAVCAVCFARKQ